jgi:sugar phosphate isomerase/epimerase
MRRYTFAPLQALHYAPPRLARLAADCGAWGIGVRLMPVVPGAPYYPLMHDAALLRETEAVLRDTGVVVFDLELLRIGPEFRAQDHLAFLELGPRLGARVVNVLTDDQEPQRLAASYAALCDAAAPFGLSCDIEPSPWSALPDVRAARALIETVRRPNVGVLVDALHFARAANLGGAGATLDDVAALPREWLHYTQMCDGELPGPSTREGLTHDARSHRLLPGEGDIDIGGLFARLPQEVPVSIEVPNDERAAAIGHEAWARAALAAARRVLEDIDT